VTGPPPEINLQGQCSYSIRTPDQRATKKQTRKDTLEYTAHISAGFRFVISIHAKQSVHKVISTFIITLHLLKSKIL
jgi:hypothetical protein